MHPLFGSIAAAFADQMAMPPNGHDFEPGRS